MQVQSLVGALRSHMLHGQRTEKKKKRYTDIYCVPGTIVLDPENTSMNQADESSFPLVGFTLWLGRQAVRMACVYGHVRWLKSMKSVAAGLELQSWVRGRVGGEQSAGWWWGPMTRSLSHLHRLLWATGRTFIPRELEAIRKLWAEQGQDFAFSFLTVPYLRCHMWALSCNMQSLVSWLGIKPRAPCIGSAASYPLDHQRSPWFML